MEATYLVSLLSTMPNKAKGVNGYITYAGIWDPEVDSIDPGFFNNDPKYNEFQKNNSASPELSAFKNEVINFSNILAIQSKDDRQVIYKQFERFQDLGKINKSKSIVSGLSLEKGSHMTNDGEINNITLGSILDFISKTEEVHHKPSFMNEL